MKEFALEMEGTHYTLNRKVATFSWNFSDRKILVLREYNLQLFFDGYTIQYSMSHTLTNAYIISSAL